MATLSNLRPESHGEKFQTLCKLQEKITGEDNESAVLEVKFNVANESHCVLDVIVEDPRGLEFQAGGYLKTNKTCTAVTSVISHFRPHRRDLIASSPATDILARRKRPPMCSSLGPQSSFGSDNKGNSGGSGTPPEVPLCREPILLGLSLYHT